MFNDTTFHFKRGQKLSTAKDFQQVLRTGKRLSHRDFVVAIKPNQLAYPRLGVIIAKKQVNSAVKRNRLKRKIRESFRLRQHHLSSIDIVFIVNKNAATIESKLLNNCLEERWKKILEQHRKLPSSLSEGTNIS